MIPVLFNEDEQVFTHNGIGALYESLFCDVIEEENGAFTMELEYPVDGEWFSEIKDFRIIQAKPNDIDEPHNFRIYEIKKSIDELTVFIRANTRTNDLGNNLITNYKGRDVTPQQAMNRIKSNLIEPTNFDLISDIQTRSNVEWTRINPLNAIVGVRGSLVDIFGGQIKRTNTAIHLYSRRGRDNVVTIRPGKNIEGLNMTVSTAGLVTKILPTFSYRPVDVPKYQMVTRSDGSREKRRVSTSGGTTLRDDITVLGDVVSSQYANNYPTNYWSSVDYGDDEELRDKVDNYIDTRLTAAEESSTILNMSGFENDLKNFVKTELDKRAKQYFTHRNPGADKPTVRITVNMLQLSDSPDWEEFKDLERIGLTDTLDVWVEEYDIDVEVRVTSLTYDSIAEQVINFNAGSDRAPRQSAIEKKYDDLTQATNDYITSFKNGVQNILRNTADGLNRKFEGYTEPPAELSSEGDIWFKEIGEGKVEIWIYDGIYWQPLMTEDFGKKIEADMLEQQKEIDDAKAAADEAVDRINNEIAGKFTDIDQELLSIETISNSAQANAQTALNRADTAIGSASDAATLAGNALTKADEAQDAATSLSGQVSGFETTVAGFNQTVNNYEGQVSGFRNDILGLESTVANYESEVDEFGNTVSTYATEVSVLTNTVSGFESTVATYGTEVSDLAGEILGYKNQVSTLNNTVSGFESTVANYTTEVNEFGDTVSTYATEISTMRNTVSGFESTVVTYGQEVNSLTGEVSTYATQVSNFSSTVDGLNSTVASKASQTQVTQLSNLLSSTVSDVEDNTTQISQNATNINLRVKKGDVVSQLNIDANRTLISSSKILLNADTVTISGTAWMSGAVITDLSVTNAKIANGTIASAKIASLDVSKISGNTTNFVQSNWNNISTQVSIDDRGINIAGANQWRRTHHNATGFDLYNGSGAYNKAGAIGYFKPNMGEAASFENIILSSRSGTQRHLIGIGVNYTHDFAIGYNPHKDTNRVFIPALEVRGDSGNIIVHSNIIAGDSGQGFGLDSASHRSNYGARVKWVTNSSTQIHFSEELFLEATQGIRFYTQSGSYKMRIHGNIDIFTNLNLDGNNISNVGTLTYKSDERFKSIIDNRNENDLDTIMAIDYKNYVMDGKKQRGFIAQELQMIDKELVIQNESGYLGYDGQGYVHTIGHAVQQLAFKEENTNQIASQALQLGETNEEKIKRLEKRIEELESAA